MKEMKRILSLVLVLVMLVGVLPATAFATETSTPVDAVIFGSDVHGTTTSSNNGYYLSNVLAGAKASGLTYSAIGFVGDTALPIATVESTVNSALGYTPYLAFSYASAHDKENSSDLVDYWDWSGEVAANTGEAYSDNYYIYSIRQDDMTSSSNASTAANNFTSWVDTADTTKPVFIISHIPMHDARGDNNGASAWFDAIQAAGEKMDIVFFWGHNHTEENKGTTRTADQAAYYVAKDGDEVLDVYNGNDDVPNFTYMNAGYINANNQSNIGRLGRMTSVALYADSMVFQDYTTTGAVSDDYSHNVTIKYEFASLGETESEVTEKTFRDNEETPWAEMTATAVSGAVTDAYDENNTTVNALFQDAYWYGYNFSLEGQVAETTVTVTLWLDPEAMTSKNLAVYHLNETTGEYEPVTGYTVGKDESEAEYIVIENAALGTYVYGTPAEEEIPEGAEFKGLTVTPPTKVKYYDTDAQPMEVNGETMNIIALESAGMKVVANYELDGEPYTKTLAWDQFGTVEGDCYSLTFAPLVAGQYGSQDVTVTYGAVTETFTVWVCAKEVTVDENTSITFDAPSVVSVAVASEEVTETIDILADKLEGTLAAYDITAEYANGDTALSGNASVTVPIPEGVENPAVYYVTDDYSEYERKTVTGKDLTAGTVTFTTDHFSKFIVGESTEIEVPNPETASGTFNSGTAGGYIYTHDTNGVNTDTAYIIVNGTTTTVLENNSTSGVTTATINSNNGTTAIASTLDYEWKIDSNNRIYTTINDTTYYLRLSTWNGASLSLTTSTSGMSSATQWTISNNDGEYTISYTPWSMGDESTTYYLTTSGYSTTSTTVRLYQYTGEAPSEVTGTYSIAGNPEELKVVTSNGSQTTLGSTLTFTPESGTATTTDTSTTATYTVVDGGDPNGVISNISGNTVTFTGKTGTALVKITYTSADPAYTVTNYITIEATSAYNTMKVYEVVDGTAGTEEVDTLAVKGVTNSITKVLSPSVTAYTADTPTGEAVTTPTVTWSVVSDNSGILDSDAAFTLGDTTASEVTGSGNVTLNFSGNGGMAVIRAWYDDNTFVDITVTASKESFYTPEDGTDDFPDYPEPGAVVLDKTATAVGDFNKTGIAQVELNMFGVPTGGSGQTDVVVMVDMTSSMDSSTDVVAAQKAVQELIETIVYDEDTNSYDSNMHLFVSSFSSGTSTSNIKIKDQLNDVTISSAEELQAAKDEIDTGTNKFTDTDYTSNGTNYGVALADVWATLNREGHATNQYVIFVTDGVPTYYYYLDETSETGYREETGSNSVTGSLAAGWFNDDGSVTEDFLTEYYTYKIKSAGIPVYTIGCNLSTTESQDDPVDLINHMSSNYSPDGKTATLKEGTTDTAETKYSFTCTTSGGITDEVLTIFRNIGLEIREAATNVQVNDKIADDYTMIFDLPDGVSSDATGGQEFYIEVVNYTLDSTDADGDGDKHERTGETSEMKLYLAKDSNGNYYAASDSSGTAFASPVFDTTAQGTMYYWTTTDISEDDDYSGVSVTVSGTTYYFDAEGKDSEDEDWDSVSSLWFNMKSGAYASGTTDDTGTSQNIIIATPYFVYNAATRILTWTTDKLGDTNQIAIRYFLYLDDSAGAAAAEQVDPGPYPTNDWASISYTNHNGNECKKYFPIPQQTWSGAQVGYTFYLVNADGKPINRSGKEVDLAAATFVTSTFYQEVTWNDDTAEPLKANILAKDHLPEQYTLYDPTASYVVHVYKDANGSDINNFFIIDGAAEGTTTSAGHTMANDNTTYVYNSINSQRYNDYGTYSGTAAVDTKISYTQDNEEKTTAVTVNTGNNIDYSSTTVAFAVLWIPTLVEDTIVVDYGLPVAINVVQNDQLDNTVNTLGTTIKNTSVVMNTGVSTNSILGLGDGATLENNTLTLVDGNRVINYGGTLYFVQNDMQFNAPSQFYYDSAVAFTKDGNPNTGYMYSKVTVIPATTVYYEDSFVDLAVYTKSGSTWALDEDADWAVDGTTTANAVQAADRPGVDKFGLTGYDADNNYGYDAAYDSYSQYSLGSARYIAVNENTYGTATFTFYGTGFDVIGLTSSNTGTITVKIYKGAEASGSSIKNLAVDTYYGYTKDADGNWVVDADAANALYQVPVISYEGLEYGQYTVVVKSAYNTALDHQGDGSYNFYLDAIRIYDPTGVVSGATTNDTNGVVSGAYNADGEAWPAYQELRANIIAASNVTVVKNADGSLTATLNNGSDTIESYDGAVFIDGSASEASISDYVSYGPNNELYLAQNQAIAFKVNLNSKTGYTIADVQIGMKSANGASVTYEINGNEKTVATTTDMYYSIMDDAIAADGSAAVVTIKNTSDSVLSLTNIKVTYEPAAVATVSDEDAGISTASLLYTDEEVVTYSLMSLRAPAVEEEVPEETEPEVPETTVPEETEPEETEPEETEPEETEPEETEPEETVPEEDTTESIVTTVKNIVNTIKNALSNLFGRWFR